MLPPHASDSTRSAAERRLFQKIRDELPGEWTVLHSLGLATHERKPWAEIDFVLVGASAIYCLEVKGGRVARNEGRWTTTNSGGQVHMLPESPFAQVGGAAAALRKHLAKAVPASTKLINGFGVVTPDVSFGISGPDIICEVVFDERDMGLPFPRYVARLEEYWKGRLGEVAGRRDFADDPKTARAIVEALRGDFDLRPSLRSQVGLVQDELTRLTERQGLVLRGLSENPRVVVRGGAGTGKTYLAVEEARRLARSGQRVLLTCFNRLLAEMLQPVASDLPSLTVRHLHGWLADVVARAGTRDTLPDAEATDLFEVFYPEACLEALLGGAVEPFDAVVVDEGQDLLRSSYVDVFDAALKGGLQHGIWRVFLDPNQDVFHGVAATGASAMLGGNPMQFQLFENCRNTAPIATYTALMSGMPLSEVLSVNGPDVATTYYENPDQQRHAVSKVLRAWLSQGIRPEEIVILSPRSRQHSCLAPGLIGVNCPLVELRADGGSGSIKFCTISAFKGLESTAVALIDVEELRSRDGAMAVYVGSSRALALLAAFLRADQQPVASARAEEFGRRLVSSA